MAVGCEPGAVGDSGSRNDIQRVTAPPTRSSSATFEAFHKLHQARRPSRVTVSVYGYDEGTIVLVLRSKRARTSPLAVSSRIALSDKLFATSSRSVRPPGTTAMPPGYGIALPFPLLHNAS